MNTESTPDSNKISLFRSCTYRDGSSCCETNNMTNSRGGTRKLVPPTLKEVEQAHLQIPPILKEVEQTRQQIPSVLKEFEAVRKEMPAALKSADKASNAVVVMSKEIEATRPLIPKV